MKGGSSDITKEPSLRYNASFIGIDEATMIKALVFLGIVAGHLCQCLCGGNADADRHTGGFPDVGRQVFSPFLQVVVIHARQVAEAFIDAVTIEGWSSLANQRHYSVCDVSVEFVVGGKDRHFAIREAFL
jgi:hypothetical protein